VKIRGSTDAVQMGTMLPGMSMLALGSFGPINHITTPFFGVPLTVLAMAAGGALVSFAYGEPEPSRKKLYTTAAANTFLAAIFVAVIPRAFGWAWSVPALEPAFAAGVAWMARWAVPTTIKLVPDILRKVFKLNKEDEEYGDYSAYRRHNSKYDKYLRSDRDDEENS
jgi:hypothetical protein